MEITPSSPCGNHADLANSVARTEERQAALKDVVSEFKDEVREGMRGLRDEMRGYRDDVQALLKQGAAAESKAQVQVARIQANSGLSSAKVAGIFALLMGILEAAKAWLGIK